MNTKLNKVLYILTVSKAVVIGLLVVTSLTGTARAQTFDDRWQINFPLYLTAGSHYFTSGSTSGSLSTVSASVEAILTSHAHPYSVGFFADYSYSADGRSAAAVSAGGLVEYEINDWDTNAYLFASKSPGTPQLWLYAGRVRYRLAENHKFGIEVAGKLLDPQASKLMIGYYGTISRSLSVNVVAGAALNSGHDLAARMELVWQIH